jgi:ribosomal protein L15E
MNVGTYKKLSRPINLIRAKNIGYQVNSSFSVVGFYKKGNKRHPLPTKGRKPTAYYSRYSGRLSGLRITKERVQRKFSNTLLKGGYKLLHHNGYNYYEIILTVK